MQDSSQPILILVRDLMFTTRIVEAARAANVPFKVVRKPELLVSETGRMLIVDLNQDSAIDAASAWRSATGGRTIGSSRTSIPTRFSAPTPRGSIKYCRVVSLPSFYRA